MHNTKTTNDNDLEWKTMQNLTPKKRVEIAREAAKNYSRHPDYPVIRINQENVEIIKETMKQTINANGIYKDYLDKVIDLFMNNINIISFESMISAFQAQLKLACDNGKNNGMDNVLIVVDSNRKDGIRSNLWMVFIALTTPNLQIDDLLLFGIYNKEIRHPFLFSSNSLWQHYESKKNFIFIDDASYSGTQIAGYINIFTGAEHFTLKACNKYFELDNQHLKCGNDRYSMISDAHNCFYISEILGDTPSHKDINISELIEKKLSCAEKYIFIRPELVYLWLSIFNKQNTISVALAASTDISKVRINKETITIVYSGITFNTMRKVIDVLNCDSEEKNKLLEAFSTYLTPCIGGGESAINFSIDIFAHKIADSWSTFSSFFQYGKLLHLQHNLPKVTNHPHNGEAWYKTHMQNISAATYFFGNEGQPLFITDSDDYHSYFDQKISSEKQQKNCSIKNCSIM